MDSINEDIVGLLQYLLPGFLAAWVFYGLTAHQKPSQFERVIQALIFTLIVQAIVSLEKWVAEEIGVHFEVGLWSDNTELIAATITAIAVGLVFSFAANHETFHKLARKLGVTRETSFPSEWFGAFFKKVTFVVLHLEDERRLYGWPKEWPSTPNQGHFVLLLPSWIVDGEDHPITGVESVLINVEDVKWVEFLEEELTAETRSMSHGKETLEPTTETNPV